MTFFQDFPPFMEHRPVVQLVAVEEGHHPREFIHVGHQEIPLGDHKLYAAQEIQRAVSEAYEEHAKPQEEGLEKVFERLGYVFSHQDGSHHIYTRPGSPRPVVIPAYGQVPVFIIQRNLRTAGATRDQ